MDINVAMAITQDQLEPQAGSIPVGTPVEFAMAEPASESPMMMAMEPVTVAGRTRSINAFPYFLMINPAIIEINPDIMIPNWAMEIRSFMDKCWKVEPIVIEVIAAI